MGHYAGELGYPPRSVGEPEREDGKCYNCDGRGLISVAAPYPSLARARRALCFDCRGSGERRAESEGGTLMDDRWSEDIVCALCGRTNVKHNCGELPNCTHEPKHHEPVAALAEPEPQDVGEAWRRGAAGGVFATWFTDDPSWPYQVAYRVPVGVEQAIRADERKRWAEREQQLVEALTAAMAYIDTCPCDTDITVEQKKAWDRLQTINPAPLLASLNQERPA